MTRDGDGVVEVGRFARSWEFTDGQAACKVLQGEVVRSAATEVDPFGSENLLYIPLDYREDVRSKRYQCGQLLDTLLGTM